MTISEWMEVTKGMSDQKLKQVLTALFTLQQWLPFLKSFNGSGLFGLIPILQHEQELRAMGAERNAITTAETPHEQAMKGWTVGDMLNRINRGKQR